jgi:hypothetical protein
MSSNPTRSAATFPQAAANSHSETAELHSEGPVARSIEHYTAQIPSDVYLWAAGGSILASLQFKGHKDESLFVGQWAAPFLLLGIYNKLVKLGGSDRTSR